MQENSRRKPLTFIRLGRVRVTIPVSQKPKIAIIGSGPVRIGQGIEFDYCTVHGVLALKKAGYETILINNNPGTVSTDFQIA